MLEKYTVRYYENLPTTKNPNKFILVGDVHGSNDPEFIQKITELALSKEKLIIFIGDIAGGDTLQKFLFLFYRTRITTQTTLIKENYFKLKEAEYALINEKYKKPDIKTIEQEMQEYYHYFHLGHYISNLPEDMKNVLKKEIKTNLDRFINIINEIKSQDPEKVIKIVSGNWDEETAFDYERNKEKLVLLPKDKRGLIVSKYLENHDIKIIRNFETFEKDNDFFVFAPYKATLNFKPQDIQWQKVNSEANKAKLEGKRIILVSHAEPIWDPYIYNKHYILRGEHPKVIAGVQSIISKINPDDIIYGHMHEDLVGPGDDKWTGDVQFYIHNLQNNKEINTHPLKIRMIK